MAQATGTGDPSGHPTPAGVAERWQPRAPGASQSGVALRLPPQSKGESQCVECGSKGGTTAAPLWLRATLSRAIPVFDLLGGILEAEARGPTDFGSF